EQPEKASRNRGALTGSGLMFFDNRKAGKFTVRASVIFRVCDCASSGTAEGCGELLWTITSSARVEHNCGRKGGLSNCLSNVETKACFQNSNDLTQVRRAGCKDVWSYANQDVEAELL